MIAEFAALDGRIAIEQCDLSAKTITRKCHDNNSFQSVSDCWMMNYELLCLCGQCSCPKLLVAIEYDWHEFKLIKYLRENILVFGSYFCDCHFTWKFIAFKYIICSCPLHY